jgi:hypothetical protein
VAGIELKGVVTEAWMSRAGRVLVLSVTVLTLVAGCNPKGSTPDAVGKLFTRDGLDNVKIAVELYKKETGRYPDSLEQLIAQKRIRGKSIIEDAWGNTYLYTKSDDSYTLFSAGPDGTPYTSDDVRPSR